MAAWWFEQTKDVAPNHVARRARSERARVRRVHAGPGRDGRARVRDGHHVDEPLDALRARRPRLLRAHASRRAEEAPEAPAADPHADDEGPQGRARRLRLARGDPRDRQGDGEGLRRGRRDRDEALRGGAAHLRRAGAHPRRHEVRVRAHARGQARRHRRDPHARLVALLAGGARTRSASAPGRTPTRSTRTSCAAGTSRQGYKGDGAAPAMPDDVRVGAAERYIAAYEQITGKTFVPDTEPPLAAHRPATSGWRDEGHGARSAEGRGARPPGRRRASRPRQARLRGREGRPRRQGHRDRDRRGPRQARRT